MEPVNKRREEIAVATHFFFHQLDQCMFFIAWQLIVLCVFNMFIEYCAHDNASILSVLTNHSVTHNNGNFPFNLTYRLILFWFQFSQINFLVYYVCVQCTVSMHIYWNNFLFRLSGHQYRMNAIKIKISASYLLTAQNFNVIHYIVYMLCIAYS